MAIGLTAAMVGLSMTQCQWMAFPSAYLRTIRTSDACARPQQCTLSWNAKEHMSRPVFAHCPSQHELKPGQSLLGIPLSEHLSQDLRAIQAGANQEFRYSSPEAYWVAHPDLKPTVQLNRDFNARFGTAQTSQLFFAYHRRFESTRKAESVLQSEIKNPTAFQNLRATKILFIPGSGIGDPFESPAFDHSTEGQLLAVALAQGLPIAWVKTLPMGPIAQNIKRVSQFLDQEISGSEPIAVIAMSRGVAEFFGALPSLSAKQTQSIRVLMNISGLVRGSFIATWSEQWGPLQFLSPMQELSNKKITPLFQRAQNKLSQIPMILNVAGLGSAKLISTDANISRIQNLLIRPFIPEAGINDGYVEYPETLIPPLSPDQQVTTLPISGSHILTDEIPPNQTDAFLYALLKVLDTQIR